MIETLLFSIADKKSNKDISSAIEELMSYPYTPKKDKDILNKTLSVAEKGSYPSNQYYSNFYSAPAFRTNSKSEILEQIDNIRRFYKSSWMKENLFKVINECENPDDITTRLAKIISNTSKGDTSNLEKFKPRTYADYGTDNLSEGIRIGVSEIDSITFGVQSGTVASIAAYTGGGKTTMLLSILYRNAIKGKKSVMFSLEVSPDLITLQLEARFMYEEKQLAVTQQDFVMHKLPKDIAEQVAQYEEEFKERIMSNILIVDETELDKRTLEDSKLLTYKYDKYQEYLGGLDIIAYDHVHQLELMFRDMGNQAIRTITSAGKTWRNNRGEKPVSFILVQVNREGFKRACKHDGVYDLAAIGDLNEVERSSSYVMFLHTTDDSKILQETKITLAKHRLGSCLTEPAVITFNPSVVTVGDTMEDVSADTTSFDSMMDDFGVDTDF